MIGDLNDYGLSDLVDSLRLQLERAKFLHNYDQDLTKEISTHFTYVLGLIADMYETDYVIQCMEKNFNYLQQQVYELNKELAKIQETNLGE